MNRTYLIRFSLFLIVILGFSSCTLFDKELEQDRHIAFYRYQMLVSFDSLEHSKDRIAHFKQILDSIEVDKALVTPRKKRGLKQNCYSFISNEYNELKEFDKGIEYANIHIESDSTDARGYFLRAVSYQKSHNDSMALKDYERARNLNPKNVTSYYNAALIYEDKGDLDNALKYYTEAIKLKPSYLGNIYVNRGNIHKLKEEYNEAIEDYNEAIELDSLNVLAYGNKGDIYNNQKNYSEAIKYYSIAIRMDSSFSKAYNRRAYSYELSGEYEKSAEDYTKAASLDSNNKLEQRELAQEGLGRIRKKLK